MITAAPGGGLLVYSLQPQLRHNSVSAIALCAEMGDIEVSLFSVCRSIPFRFLRFCDMSILMQCACVE